MTDLQWLAVIFLVGAAFFYKRVLRLHVLSESKRDARSYPPAGEMVVRRLSGVTRTPRFQDENDHREAIN